jgi:hypothetical protein
MPGQGRVSKKIVMWSCSVIVNASLRGGAQTRLAASCRNFERRWFAWGTEINSGPGRVTQKKS